MKSRSSQTLQLWRGAQHWIPADPIQWSALNTDHSPWSLGWAGFSLLLFLKVIYREQEVLSVWMDMSVRKSVTVSWPWFSVLQVSSVRYSWWSLGEAWCSLEGLWNSPVQPLDSQSVATGWTGSARLQERGWNVLQQLVVVAHTTQTLWRADSPSPETRIRTSCICKWKAWEPRTQPCIIVQETQWGDFSVSPDINLSAVLFMTSRWRSAHTDLRVSFVPGAAMTKRFYDSKHKPFYFTVIFYIHKINANMNKV
jgi:hypothetical protein